jgi:hypothetical protein
MLRQIILALMGGWWGLMNAPYASAQATPTTFRDGGTVYRTGLQPNSSVRVELGNSPVAKTIYSDACGMLKISLGSSFPSDLTVNNVPVGSAYSSSLTYRCNNGMAQYSGPAPSANYITGDGKITLFVIPGNSNGANQASFVTYTAPLTKTFRANACGVLAIKKPNIPFTAASQLAIANGSYSTPRITFGDLPTAPAPICLNGNSYAANSATPTQGGANLYRTEKTIYQVGLTPNSLAVVQFDGTTSRSFSPRTSNGVSCGVFVLLLPATGVTQVKIDGTSVNLASAPVTSGLYDCSNPSSLQALSVGTLYKYTSSTDTYYFYRNPAKLRLVVEYPATISKNYPVNTCGFTTINSPNRANGFGATDVVKINGVETTLAAIPLTSKPPVCRNGVLYQAP